MSATRAPGDAASRLAAAVEQVGGDAPASFSCFEEAVRGLEPQPDFTEHSACFGSRLEAHRLTHYFDVDGGADARVRDVGSRFLALAERLSLPVPAELAALALGSLPGRVELQQVVLGIDARRPPARTRLKYYFVLRRAAADLVDAARAALSLRFPARLDPSEVFLVGVDVDASGASDAKLYLRLDRTRLGRTLRVLPEIAPLVHGARTVVLSQSLADPKRRQLHFHATDEAIYADWLSARATSDPGVRSLVDHARSVEAALGGPRLGPWIIGLPYVDGAVSVGSGNVYFHLTDTRSR